jgi:hypothetical protein
MTTMRMTVKPGYGPVSHNSLLQLYVHCNVVSVLSGRAQEARRGNIYLKRELIVDVDDVVLDRRRTITIPLRVK